MTAADIRALMDTNDVVYAPGVWDGMSSRIAELSGFSALCASGFAISAALGMPDAEMYTATENLDAVRRIREGSSLPVIADIDTGYGNAINARRTAQHFRQVGVSAVFMEDQVAPKRCPICVGDPVEVLPIGEAAGKVRAVAEAMEGEVLVIARIDSVGDDALRRAEAYRDAGADVIMPVSKTFDSLEQWKKCHDITGLPLMAALTAWTWVERDFTADAMVEAGIKIALLPTQIVLAAATGARDAMGRLAKGEEPASVSKDFMRHEEFIELIGFPAMEALQQTYLPATVEA